MICIHIPIRVGVDHPIEMGGNIGFGAGRL
jgi:hypothetical protein